MPNAFIRKLQGFTPLDSLEIDALAGATAHPRKFVAKQDIVREGDAPGPVLVVLEGWVCRYKVLPAGTRQITAFLMPGDACDLHISMLDEMDHSIQAVSTCQVAAIPRERMEELMESRAVARAMYIAQLVDEGILRAWIVSMGRRSSVQRVAHLMCELYLRAQGIGLVTNEGLSLPFSQLVMADALGMTPVHMNRVLKTLRDAGAMELRRGGLVILNPPKLVEIAGFDENYLHRRIGRVA